MRLVDTISQLLTDFVLEEGNSQIRHVNDRLGQHTFVVFGVYISKSYLFKLPEPSLTMSSPLIINLLCL